jgi:hypothetical protein
MMFKDFWFVMAFYAILSCFIMPFIGYKVRGVNGLGQGYVIGSIVSLLLWFTVGRKYAKI